MYLRCHKRIKDGKEHRYRSVVESVRTKRGVMKRQLLYLGELNDSQRAQWCSALDVLDESDDSVQQMSLFPEDRTLPPEVSNPVQIRLSKMSLRHPRQWGGCWLAMELWNQLGLDSFWSPRLPQSRKGTEWLNVLKTLVAYRLLDPGSEWRLHPARERHPAASTPTQPDPAGATATATRRAEEKMWGRPLSQNRRKKAFSAANSERWVKAFSNASIRKSGYDQRSSRKIRYRLAGS